MLFRRILEASRGGGVDLGLCRMSRSMQGRIGRESRHAWADQQARSSSGASRCSEKPLCYLPATSQVWGGPHETLRHTHEGACAHPVTQASALQELVGRDKTRPGTVREHTCQQGSTGGSSL